MNVVIFGASGMVGQGLLRECLLDPDVQRVITVGRSSSGRPHDKLTDIVHKDLFDLSAIEPQLTGVQACFYTLGVSSVGLSEEEYSRITYDLTVSVAQTMLRLNPGLTFVFVSGTGTDSSAQGSVMWARVKGKAENALLAMPFGAAWMFRPGYIQPLHGIKSKTGWYNVFYTVLRPLLPILTLLPGLVTTTERLGRAMLAAAKRGAPKRLLENRDINRLVS